ncbi:hypothetical protein ACJMK2_006599 [Sinanodonta woodiana]|uniref:Uncharacterized protein n=1 Tax=Sinanodonta woodiana TaxID=1069815 RepID=A0ABD3VWS4_SINWO
MKDAVQQSVQVMPSSTRARQGTSTSSSDDSNHATQGSRVIQRPNGSWGPIFKNRDTFVEMHLA